MRKYVTRIPGGHPDHHALFVAMLGVFLLVCPVSIHSKTAKDFPPSIRYRNIRVQPGDTLKTIARKYLHDVSRWKELRKINRVFDPEQITVGRVIRIPRLEIGITTQTIRRVIRKFNNLQPERIKKELPLRYRSTVDFLDNAEWDFDHGRFKQASIHATTARKTIENIEFHFSLPPEPLRIRAGIDGGPVDLRYGQSSGDSQLTAFHTAGTGKLKLTADGLWTMTVSPSTSGSFLNGRCDSGKKTYSMGMTLQKGNIYFQSSALNSQAIIRGPDGYFIFFSPGKLKIRKTPNRMTVSILGGKVYIPGNGDYFPGQNISLHGEEGKIKEIQIETPSPQPDHPAQGGSLRTRDIRFSWEITGKKIHTYRFELSNDPYFLERLLNIHNIRKKKITVKDLDEGHYYWRVSVEKKQRVLSVSPRMEFEIDRTSPGLRLLYPRRDILIIENPKIRFEGRADRDATNGINGTSITLNRAGLFTRKEKLYQGLNLFLFYAVDRAGNESHTLVQVMNFPFSSSAFYSDSTWYVKNTRLNIILPGQKYLGVFIGSNPLPNETGIFSSEVNLAPDTNIIPLRFVLPGKSRREISQSLRVIQDNEPPVPTSFSPQNISGTGVITVFAHDAGSGLADTASMSLEDSRGVGVYLRGVLDREENVYKFHYNVGNKKLRVEGLHLSDRLGNPVEVTRETHIPGLFR